MEGRNVKKSSKLKIKIAYNLVSQKGLLLLLRRIKACRSDGFKSAHLCFLSCRFPDKVLPWRMSPAHQPVCAVEASLLLHGPTPTGKCPCPCPGEDAGGWIQTCEVPTPFILHLNVDMIRAEIFHVLIA